MDLKQILQVGTKLMFEKMDRKKKEKQLFIVWANDKGFYVHTDETSRMGKFIEFPKMGEFDLKGKRVAVNKKSKELHIFTIL